MFPDFYPPSIYLTYRHLFALKSSKTIGLKVYALVVIRPIIWNMHKIKNMPKGFEQQSVFAEWEPLTIICNYYWQFLILNLCCYFSQLLRQPELRVHLSSQCSLGNQKELQRLFCARGIRQNKTKPPFCNHDNQVQPLLLSTMTL